MDPWPLLSLVGLAYLVMPIFGLAMAFSNNAKLRELDRRIEELARRIAQVPRAAAAAETPAPPITAPQEPPLLAIDESPALLAPEPGVPEISEEPPAAVPPPSPPASEPAPRPAQSATPSRPAAPPAIHESFEQRFGTRWVVWIGGVALALGGIFLVNYAVEQGYFGPGVRILLASILAAFLIAAGEWAHRSERVSGLVGIARAHVPSVLTAAGTIVAFATAYAAFALYGFIGPAAGFVLLGAIAIITLAAALRHGPALAALGLIGAQGTPLLVTTATPNYWALYIYLAVVTAAAFALARARCGAGWPSRPSSPAPCGCGLVLTTSARLPRMRFMLRPALPWWRCSSSPACGWDQQARPAASIASRLAGSPHISPRPRCSSLRAVIRTAPCWCSRCSPRPRLRSHGGPRPPPPRCRSRPYSPRWSWPTGCWRRKTCF
jgi:hypothetical protein